MAGGDYGRVRGTFWTDPDVKRVLTPEQKTLLLYWFTSPHRTLIGLYYCPFEYASSETGLPLELVHEWTLGALAKFVTYDQETEEVLVHGAAKHQIGEDLKKTDNQRKAIKKALEEAHSSELVRRFLTLYEHWSLDVRTPPPDPQERKPLRSPFEGSKARSKPAALAAEKVDSVDKSESPRNSTGSEAPPKPLESPSEAIAVAVAVTEQLQSKPATAREADGGQRAACVEFVKQAGYGAREALIAEGEDATAWNTPTGDRVPWPDRLRLLKLAHARVQDGSSERLRSALRYVIPEQYDPFEAPRSDRPKPGTEAAAVRSETPQERDRTISTTGLVRIATKDAEPERPVVDLEGERVKRWAADNPDAAERIRTAIALRARRGEGPRGERAQKAWAEAEFRTRVLDAMGREAAA